jgi:hypothetical protein
MVQLTEGKLVFSFNTASIASKYDEWTTHKKLAGNGIKAVDFVVKNDDNCYLIEVKDYLENKRSKPSELHEEIFHKVIGTLAGIASVSKNQVNSTSTPRDSSQSEQEISKQLLQTNKFIVVLHIEGSNKFIGDDIANILMKMKKILKFIGTTPKICNSTDALDFYTTTRLN